MVFTDSTRRGDDVRYPRNHRCISGSERGALSVDARLRLGGRWRRSTVHEVLFRCISTVIMFLQNSISYLRLSLGDGNGGGCCKLLRICSTSTRSVCPLEIRMGKSHRVRLYRSYRVYAFTPFKPTGLVLAGECSRGRVRSRSADQLWPCPINSGTSLTTPKLPGDVRWVVPEIIKPPPHTTGKDLTHPLVFLCDAAQANGIIPTGSCLNGRKRFTGVPASVRVCPRQRLLLQCHSHTSPPPCNPSKPSDRSGPHIPYI